MTVMGDGPTAAVSAGAPSTQAISDGPTVHTLILSGDEHIHDPPTFQGVLRGLLAESVAPGHRLPASNLGITQAMTALHARALTPGQRASLRGLIAMGDAVDVSSVRELETYFKTLRFIQKVNPLEQMLLFTIGNHEVLHAGVSHSGGDFFGFWGLFLNLSGPRSHKKDIQIPEVGGARNALDKKKFIEAYYKFTFGKGPKPVILHKFNNRYYTLKEAKTHLKKKSNWYGSEKISEKVFNDFWRYERNQRVWNALIHYPKGGEQNPEESWFYATATKLNDFKTSNGTYPIYAIAIDSMDYLVDSRSLGALDGHISHVQIKVVQNFILEMKRRNPHAKFVLVSHYPMGRISNIKKTGISHILSDEAVIAVIGAHTHKREYEDLAENKSMNSYGIVGRNNPLPQVVVPSPMDYPNEIVKLRYGIEPRNPEQIFFTFDFVEIDSSRLPGNSEAVCTELKSIRPELLIYDDALAHIKNPQIRQFATPGSPLFRRIDIGANLDTGLVTKPGKIHDELIADDVIPTMVEDTQYYLRAFTSVTKLSLTEAGMDPEAKEIELLFREILNHLNHYYERIWRDEFTEIGGDHLDIHKLDTYQNDLAQTTTKVVKKIQGQLKDPSLTPRQKQLLKLAANTLPDIKGFFDDYRFWLKRYERNRRTERRPSEMINEADLGGSLHFKAVMKQLRAIPYGSWAWSFLVHAFFEAGEQRAEFYGGQAALQKKVPDTIRVVLNTTTGIETVHVPPLSAAERATQRRHWCDPKSPPHAKWARQRSQAWKPAEKTGIRGIESHWSLRTGIYWQGAILAWNADNAGLSGTLGFQTHLLNRWDAPRINIAAGLGGSVGFDGRGDMFLRMTPTIGDPWGVLELGPVLTGGMAFAGDVGPFDLFIGAGGGLALAEGTLSFEASYFWFGKPERREDTVRVTINTDIFAPLRYFNVISRDF